VNKIGTVILLNSGEQDVCIFAAQSRMKYAEIYKRKNLKVSDDDAFQIDLNGFGAEMAFCKMNNLYPDFSNEAKKNGIDIGDALLDGKRVDIKTTKRKNGHLIAGTWKEQTVDVYALLVGEFPEYEFKGYMPACELFKENRLKNLSTRPCYAAKQNELVEWHELWLFAEYR
jgi:hypothetical protein